jgi:hypothetical protein
MDGSETTTPRPFAKTRVLAVPRSIAKSLEKRPKMLDMQECILS